MGELILAKYMGTPPPERKITLQTSKGSDIKNYQAVTPDKQSIATYNRFKSNKFGWKHRKASCGVYNCFGLVWASRRTAIEADQINIIFKDDEYKVILESALLPGDLVIYKSKGNTNTIFHVALITEIMENMGISTPWALSKWNDAAGEDLHAIKDIPESWSDICDIESLEYWTDRK